MSEYSRPAMVPMTMECRASAEARAPSPAPSARLMAEDTPLPMAPLLIICVSMASGNTRAMAASDTVPSCPT